MVYSLCLSAALSSVSSPKPLTSQTPSPSQNPPLYIKFRTSHRVNLRYLRTLGLIDPKAKLHTLPSPEAVDQLIARVDFFQSKGFSDSDFPRIAFLCPQLFSPDFDPAETEPVFEFLANDVVASAQESCGLITRHPQILLSNVEYRLKPALDYLRQLGVEKLNVPTTLNAHLLNTQVEKLRAKIRFLRSIGLKYEESATVCARLPAIFGYSIEENLRPKYEYLVEEMERSVEELKGFPQYFGFSLRKRIAPRHLHLKQRNVRVPLNRMLMWSDERFYAKWK
ncbi:transcription termination factor MTEF1, chloroplastic [Punica granatum]|uniref:Uncharacterized protein n=2 Tax=Punica granatum TaxID=22663 RepID=A0A218XG68_PUNGR|nr:transcription termination factor MTEF1, chloroplastic [Punica granatum]OWM83788.1 hypothetical protein CDL15_Pgr004219 [Punica granatum]PKI47528.1 hypothetical protein CRG98_032118 [Punica granatum]